MIRSAELIGRSDELEVLDEVVEAVREGESRALVLRGEPGVGKTVLLDHLAGRATTSGCRVARIAGVQSELELAFAGLHQLCLPMLDRADRLPEPQREALLVACGLIAGPAPDRFFVGLALLSLLSDLADETPLICLVDDLQWLDDASAKALGFAARRLAADPVGLVFSIRDSGAPVAGVRELPIDRLNDQDSRALLATALTGRLDEQVSELIVAESRGNPLALLELPRGLAPAELAGGFGLPSAIPLTGRIEDMFLRRLEALPDPTRRLLQLAAADPSGDRSLVERAAARLGIPGDASAAAAQAGLAEFSGGQVRFRHPLARSAAYRSASLDDRLVMHAALAEATDQQTDPDRRAWHRSQAAAGPDEDVAAELERSAGRALARGGLAAVAALLERSALLTPEPGPRAQRLLAAAQAKRDAGALDAALELLELVETGPPDGRRTAEATRLRGQIALDLNRAIDGARLLLSAAQGLEPFDIVLARETHLESLMAAIFLSEDLAAQAARAVPPDPELLRPADILVNALALRFLRPFAEIAPVYRDALTRLAAGSASEVPGRLQWRIGPAIGLIATDLLDDDAWATVSANQVNLARRSGALVQLQIALNNQAGALIFFGELAAAEQLLEEDRLIAEATGNPPVAISEMMAVAWRGQERRARELISARTRELTAVGMGRGANLGNYVSAILDNGIGQHEAARDALIWVVEDKSIGFRSLAIPELAEAASRTGDRHLVRAAHDWLAERVKLTPTEWALGAEARVRALLTDGDEADGAFRESIGHLGRTRLRAELARSHLLYGEWLRRKGRRADARQQLRTAHEMLGSMGIEAFAARAGRELAATGETVRKRTPETATALTPQEAHIARLARDGRTNSEIGTELFLSARTVEWHLGKIFTKLGVGSRRELPGALARLGPGGV
jgi:DNA-binding CsgD family transcriptional regulator